MIPVPEELVRMTPYLDGHHSFVLAAVESPEEYVAADLERPPKASPGQAVWCLEMGFPSRRVVIPSALFRILVRDLFRMQRCRYLIMKSRRRSIVAGDLAYYRGVARTGRLSTGVNVAYTRYVFRDHGEEMWFNPVSVAGVCGSA